VVVQFYYVRRLAGSVGQELEAQLEEVKEARWFTLAELDDLPTFEQVRSLARFAIANYPVEAERG